MFTSLIKELLGTKIAECNEICQTLMDDEYKSSDIASQEELKVLLVANVNLNYSRYIHLSASY